MDVHRCTAEPRGVAAVAAGASKACERLKAGSQSCAAGTLQVASQSVTTGLFALTWRSCGTWARTAGRALQVWLGAAHGCGIECGVAGRSVACTQGEVNVHTLRVKPSGTRSRPPVLMSSCRPIVHACQVHLGSGKQRFTWLQLFGSARRSQLGIGACCLAVLQLDRQVSGAVLLGAQGAVCVFREHQSLQ